MSPKLKRLSGKEVLSILSNEKQSLTIVMHDELDVGTLHAILRQASRFIPEDQLKKEFYSD